MVELLTVQERLPEVNTPNDMVPAEQAEQPQPIESLAVSRLRGACNEVVRLLERNARGFTPDAYINLYPAKDGACWWTMHDTAEAADACEEPGAIFVAVPVCLAKGKKPVGAK